MLSDAVELRFAGPGDEKIDGVQSKLVDHLMGILTEEELSSQVNVLDSFIEDQIDEGFDLGYQPAILTSSPSQKEIAVNILCENGFTEYAEDYADFFLSFMKKSAPPLNEWLSHLGNSNQSRDAIMNVRHELINALRNDPEIASTIGYISESSQYIFEENELSNRIAKELFIQILAKDSVLKALYDDTLSKNGGASRCVSVLPSRVTYTDGTTSVIAFVGMSGYVSEMEPALPICRLHAELKHHIDNTTLAFPEMEEAIEFRYIEGDSRRFNLILHQMNRAMSGNHSQALDAASKVLPSNAMKGCAEKKLVSELSKHHMDKKNENIQQIHILGETNIQLPHLSHFHQPKTQKPEQIECMSLTPTGEKEVKELKKLKNALHTAIEKHKNYLFEKGWQEDESGKWTYPESAPKRTVGEAKRQSKAVDLVTQKYSKLHQLRSRKELVLAKHTQFMFYVEVSSNIAHNKPEKVFLPLTRIPACKHCQHQKPSYLATILHSANIDFQKVYERASAPPSPELVSTSAKENGASCSEEPKSPNPIIPYSMLERERENIQNIAVPSDKLLQTSPKRVAISKKIRKTLTPAMLMLS